MQRIPQSFSSHAASNDFNSPKMGLGYGQGMFSPINGSPMANLPQTPPSSPFIILEKRHTRMMSPIARSQRKASPSPASRSPKDGSFRKQTRRVSTSEVYQVSLHPVVFPTQEASNPFIDQTNVLQTTFDQAFAAKQSGIAEGENLQILLTPSLIYVSPSLTPLSPKHANENINSNYKENVLSPLNENHIAFSNKGIEWNDIKQDNSFTGLLHYSNKPKKEIEAKVYENEYEISAMKKALEDKNSEDKRDMKVYMTRLKQDNEVLKGFMNPKSTFRPKAQ